MGAARPLENGNVFAAGSDLGSGDSRALLAGSLGVVPSSRVGWNAGGPAVACGAPDVVPNFDGSPVSWSLLGLGSLVLPVCV